MQTSVTDMIANQNPRRHATPELLQAVSRSFVLEAMAEVSKPGVVIATSLLDRRTSVILRILQGALSRVKGSRPTMNALIGELTDRETHVCWLVACGQIEMNTPEVH